MPEFSFLWSSICPAYCPVPLHFSPNLSWISILGRGHHRQEKSRAPDHPLYFVFVDMYLGPTSTGLIGGVVAVTGWWPPVKLPSSHGRPVAGGSPPQHHQNHIFLQTFYATFFATLFATTPSELHFFWHICLVIFLPKHHQSQFFSAMFRQVFSNITIWGTFWVNFVCIFFCYFSARTPLEPDLKAFFSTTFLGSFFFDNNTITGTV